MGEKVTTSIRITEEQREFVESTDMNLSAWVRERLDEEMTAATMTREERLKQKISEKREELDEAKDCVGEIEQELTELENKLERHREEERSQVNQVLEVVEETMRELDPGQWKADHQYFRHRAKEAGLTADQFATLFDHINVHDPRGSSVVCTAARLRLDRELHDYDDPERVAEYPDELIDEIIEEHGVESLAELSHWEARGRFSDDLMQLSSGQKQRAREWLRDELATA